MTSQVADRVRTVLEIPLHLFLNIALGAPQRPEAGVLLPVEEPALNNVEVLDGGVVSALLDVASYLALLPLLADGEHAVTHDMTVSRIRPARRGAVLQLGGTVARKGRSVVFLRAEARVAGEVVATAQVTKALVSPA